MCLVYVYASWCVYVCGPFVYLFLCPYCVSVSVHYIPSTHIPAADIQSCSYTYILYVKVSSCIMLSSVCVCACVHINTVQANWLSVLRATVWESQLRGSVRSLIIQICLQFVSVCVPFTVCICVCANMHPIVCACTRLLVKSPASSGHDTQRQLPACRLRAKHIASEITDARHTAQLWD